MEKLDIKPKIEFSDRMRIWFKWFLDPVAAFFNRIGLTPNTMTLLGLAGNFAAAYFVSRGQISLGGLLMLLTTPFDALDGTMARLRGDASDWGAFVDSVTDRYSELAVLGGLLVHFSTIGDGLSAIATFAAAAGTVLVSYVKARAEAVGFSAKVGFLTRVERYLVLGPLLLFNQPVIAAWFIAVFANFTALQRIFFVRAQARERKETPGNRG
ncbi:MAG: CDP-alcohol phosphatidyltransferase family protein [Anaerolineae bacterium CFX3]|nr:CDP-alcohol phosphatidyltransferase family protein [Anaerolineae bacterium]MCE7906681.1 CDP-alcohol phosphatidyltransferase family protein [Anaerolineae bacterium CFX3]MCQ3948125.1 CDP-alcohol phosphatidyltransferase family protein [Anaerolineae bacterium]MCZ2290251.1 CDP-alcohol phosphatidyltransferase family protein [Anaerolineales bacterium]RIK28189.1 MAG: CDP-alcohol phosphatidyltransferase family protein [Anaerolineae bacterium]